MTPDRNPGSEKTFSHPAQIETVFNDEIIATPLSFSVAVREMQDPTHAAFEDRSIIDTDKGIFAVFDGMGGHGNGDVAAQAAAESVYESLGSTTNIVASEEEIKDELSRAFADARYAVEHEGRGGKTVATAVKFYIMNGKHVMGVAHAGDTRLFKYSKDTGVRQELTTDQSEGNRVSNGLYYKTDKDPDEYLVIDVAPDDRFMLCSDGITGDWGYQFLSDREYQRGFAQQRPDDAVDYFMKASKKPDDKTVIVFDPKEEVQSTTEESPQAPRVSRKKKRQIRGYERQQRADMAAHDTQPPSTEEVDSPEGYAAVEEPSVFGPRLEALLEVSKTTGRLDDPGAFEVVTNERGLDVYPYALDAGVVSAAIPRSIDSDDRERYDSADRELARNVARRTKLGMFSTRKTREQLDREIEASAEIYDEQAKIFEKIQIDRWKTDEPDITDAKLAEKLAKYHTDKERLHNLRTQEEFRQTRGRFGKLSEWNDRASEWYAGLSRKEKVIAAAGGIAVGVVLGGAIAATGAVLGTGVAAAGGALLAGAKVYKAGWQARSGLYGGLEEVEQIESRNANGGLKSQYQLREEASSRMERRRKEKAEHADKVNRRAKIATIIAGVALIGGGIISHTDLGRDIGELFGERFAPVPDPDQTSTPSPSPSPTGGGEAPIGDADGSTTRPPVERPPEVPVPAPTPELPPPPAPEYGLDAMTVENGEGWYQTFSEMGITNPTEQANLLQKVGPELQARGWARAVDGSYWITHQGALPKDVLDFIKNSR